MAKKKTEKTENVVTQSIDKSNVIFCLNGNQVLRIPRNSCRAITLDDWNAIVTRFRVRNIEKWALFFEGKFYLRSSPISISNILTKVGTKQKIIVKKLIED